MGASELRVASVQYVQAYDFLFFVAYSYRVADAVASAATVRASVSGLRSRPVLGLGVAIGRALRWVC